MTDDEFVAAVGRAVGAPIEPADVPVVLRYLAVNGTRKGLRTTGDWWKFVWRAAAWWQERDAALVDLAREDP